MGCGPSSSHSGSGGGGARTERRAAENSQREVIGAYVSTFLMQPIFHARMQSALRQGGDNNDKARGLEALETVRTKLADYCDVFSDDADHNAFNAKLRASLSEAQCEAFAALRLDPVKLAHAVMDTLQKNPECFPRQLATCFSLLVERPGGLGDIKLPPGSDDGSDAPDAEELEAMDARLGIQLGNDAETVAEEFSDSPVMRKGKKPPNIKISLGVAESSTGRASLATRGQQRQEAMAELKRLRERQAKARRGSAPDVGSPKWVPELQNHPLRSDKRRTQLAVEEGPTATTGTRRRVKRSAKRVKEAMKRETAARRPSVPAIASPKWVTVDPDARLPAAITSKGKAARAEMKRHRRRHSAMQQQDKARRGARGYSLAGDLSDGTDDEDWSVPLIARMSLPAHGKLMAKERPGSAPMSPGVYEPPTPSVRSHAGVTTRQLGKDGCDTGLSVEEFERRMAEWLEYNRRERISPGTGVRPLPLNAPGKQPHLVSPQTPVPLRASDVHSFKPRRGKNSETREKAAEERRARVQRNGAVSKSALR